MAFVALSSATETLDRAELGRLLGSVEGRPLVPTPARTLAARHRAGRGPGVVPLCYAVLALPGEV